MESECDSLVGMSKTFRAWDVDQAWLLPPSVHDFVPAGHAAHLVRDAVRESLDLSAILSVYGAARGQPAYHPAMMVALLLYAYSVGVYSSRRIAKACEDLVDFITDPTIVVVVFLQNRGQGGGEGAGQVAAAFLSKFFELHGPVPRALVDVDG